MKRHLARAAAALAVALSAGALPGAPLAAVAPGTVPGTVPASAHPAEGTAPDQAVQLSSVAVTPAAPRPHEMLHISGVARSNTAVTGNEVRLRVSSLPLTSRDALHAAAVETDRPVDSHDVRPHVPVGDVTPGTDTPWAIDVPIDDLHLTFGVYRLTVEFFDPGFYVRGRVNTFLPYFPSGDGWQPTNVAWVWPLVDAPRREGLAQPKSLLKPSAGPTVADVVGTPAVAAPAEVFLDDSLAQAVAHDGRLGELVAAAADAAQQHGDVPPAPAPAPMPTRIPTPAGSAAATPARTTGRPAGTPKPVPATATAPVAKLPIRPVPVSWAIDPDLLDSARSMAAGYVIRDNGQTRPGPAAGRSAAASWLSAVTSTVGDSPVIPLPYADADLVALARAGHNDEVSLALRAGPDADSIFRAVLSRQIAPSIVWPVDGVVTQNALDVLAQEAQVSAIVLADGALPLRDASAGHMTPGTQGPPLSAGGGKVQPLLSDATLDLLIAADPGSEDIGLAQQRFLAETAMITAELPTSPRDILLLPPRHAANVDYLRRLLTLTGRVPWLNGITIDDALRHPADPAPRGPLTYPETAKSQEVSRPVIAATVNTRTRLAMLGSILTEPAVLTATDHGLLRTYSASWRQDAPIAESVRADAAREIEDWIRKVSIVTSRDTLTLASRSAKIPLTISNGLDQDVHNLTVLVRAANSANLQEIQQDGVGVKTHDREQLNLAAKLAYVGSVRFPVTLSLQTRDGRVLSSVPLQVHSAGSGGPVLVVTVVLIALLFLVVAVRLIRRVWQYYAARRTAAAS